jgi:hypothetical protein
MQARKLAGSLLPALAAVALGPALLTGTSSAAAMTQRAAGAPAARAGGTWGTAQHMSPLTAKTHISRTMAKLGARDRAQLVVTAYQTGLVRPGLP